MGDNIIRPLLFACWISKATATHSQYEILIPCTKQQWLRDCTSMLCFLVHCLHFICRPVMGCHCDYNNQLVIAYVYKLNLIR